MLTFMRKVNNKKKLLRINGSNKREWNCALMTWAIRSMVIPESKLHPQVYSDHFDISPIALKINSKN